MNKGESFTPTIPKQMEMHLTTKIMGAQRTRCATQDRKQNRNYFIAFNFGWRFLLNGNFLECQHYRWQWVIKKKRKQNVTTCREVERVCVSGRFISWFSIKKSSGNDDLTQFHLLPLLPHPPNSFPVFLLSFFSVYALRIARYKYVFSFY